LERRNDLREKKNPESKKMELLGKRTRKVVTENSSSSKHARGNASVTRHATLQHGNETKLLSSVALSIYDKAAQLVLSPDQLTCFGCDVSKLLIVSNTIVIGVFKGGYRMVRATHGIHKGSYLWEAEILPPQGSNAHVRIGWSTRQGELQSSVGFDQYSFGYRDIDGIGY
jgi:hypothetical protein